MNTERWSDLKVRVRSAIAMVAVFAASLWFGETALLLVLGVIAVAVHYELASIAGLNERQRLWVVGSSGIVWLWVLFGGGLTVGISNTIFLPLCVGLIPILVIHFFATENRVPLYLYGLLAVVGLMGFGGIILLLGSTGVILLALIIIVSDTAGYFAGRMIGGQKFWPRISPKKTWSGTIAGWIGAAIVGAIYDFDIAIILSAVLLAFAAQMGDIAESALKRKVGIKDSSNLIPGHGGVLDRFDGFIGAGALACLVGAVLQSL